MHESNRSRKFVDCAVTAIAAAVCALANAENSPPPQSVRTVTSAGGCGSDYFRIRNQAVCNAMSVGSQGDAKVSPNKLSNGQATTSVPPSVPTTSPDYMRRATIK